jgi:hypothetical protein
MTSGSSRVYGPLTPRRNSIGGGGHFDHHHTPITSLRVPVDVNKLKEWNLQFMRNYIKNNIMKQSSSMPVPADATCKAMTSSSSASLLSDSPSGSSCARESNMSLNSLMAGARHQRRYHHQIPITASASSSAAAELQGIMDTTMTTATTNNTIATPTSFLPIQALRPMVRRDSLFGSNC